MNSIETRLMKTDLVGRGMAQWRSERPDIDCSGKAVVGRIVHLHDIILRTVNRALRPHGVRYPTYAVLVTIRVAGEPYSMSPGLLSEVLLLSSGGLSNLLRKMEAEGYVVRRPDTRDKRGVIVQLTDKGVAKAEECMTVHAEVERELAGCLPPERQAEVASALGLMIATAER